MRLRNSAQHRQHYSQQSRWSKVSTSKHVIKENLEMVERTRPMANRTSRIVNIDSEWELSVSISSKIESQFGPFSVDLFASCLNEKCKNFYSRFPDPQASSVHTLTI